tara:strand:+ start:306 stop:452 length:147 start_codon:yes stop_codon:yes gene_type:complete
MYRYRFAAEGALDTRNFENLYQNGLPQANILRITGLSAGGKHWFEGMF